MFNVGAGEITIILVVALLLLGPDRLPEMARMLGKFVREFRKQTDDVRVLVEREFYRMDEDLNDQLDARLSGPTNPGVLVSQTTIAEIPVSSPPVPDEVGESVEPTVVDAHFVSGREQTVTRAVPRRSVVKPEEKPK